MKKLLFIILISSSLQGCIFIAGAAAGAAIAAGVYDHRKIEQVLEDQSIANNIADRINSTPRLRDNHIEVSSFNQIVLLTGEVTSSDLIAEAENISRAEPGVCQVYNQLRLKGPASSLTRASDSWITAKIKAQLLATADLKSGSIKVITENGTVYLMGKVTKDQGDIASDIARNVDGVQKVIRVFKYTD